MSLSEPIRSASIPPPPPFERFPQSECPISGVNPDAFSHEGTSRAFESMPAPPPIIGLEPDEMPVEEEVVELPFYFRFLGVLKLMAVAGLLMGGFFLYLNLDDLSASGGSDAQASAGASDSLAAVDGSSVAPGVASDTGASSMQKDKGIGSIGHFLAEQEVNGFLIRGQDSKIMLNGKTYKVGDSISKAHELVFLGFKKKSKQAVFMDPEHLYYTINVF